MSLLFIAAVSPAPAPLLFASHQPLTFFMLLLCYAHSSQFLLVPIYPTAGVHAAHLGQVHSRLSMRAPTFLIPLTETLKKNIRQYLISLAARKDHSHHGGTCKIVYGGDSETHSDTELYSSFRRACGYRALLIATRDKASRVSCCFSCTNSSVARHLRAGRNIRRAM